MIGLPVAVHLHYEIDGTVLEGPKFRFSQRRRRCFSF